MLGELVVSLVCAVFKSCVSAMRNSVLVVREGQQDKEFHFQNWFKSRLDDVGEYYDESGRNTYPDFTIVGHREGYEVKGLAYPGRVADYDCNSQFPCGEHNGRQVFYVFGRYPKSPDGNRYPVLDLVVCHGSFLNADNTYTHKNESFRGLGSYGDILVRDRKMYVAPTPFELAHGSAHHRTLILPDCMTVDEDLIEVATLVRREVARMIVSYSLGLIYLTRHPTILKT